MTDKNYYRLLQAIFFAVLVWSGISPHDYYTWFLEVIPALLGLGIIWFLYWRGWRFSRFVYGWLVVHAAILMIGGHSTYAEMPLFNWLRDTFDLARNYYDRLGHFAQGFIPALVAREILIRQNIVNGRGWLYFIVISICLSISAAYEFFEWWVAIASGTAAEAFLGTQGDVWDTQWDMFMCLIGANVALLTMTRWHERSISRLGK